MSITIYTSMMALTMPVMKFYSPVWTFSIPRKTISSSRANLNPSLYSKNLSAKLSSVDLNKPTIQATNVHCHRYNFFDTNCELS